MEYKSDGYLDAPGLLPILPKDILQQLHVNEPGDSRFASCARALQSIWRERLGLAPGYYRSPKGASRILGSRLRTDDARKGRNFLTPDIARIARREAAYREIGALIEERRLWENLLASQSLTFNLFARCRTNPGYASRVFSALFPGLFAKVDWIAFEHSPGRGDPTYLGDYTAFDLFVSGGSSDGKPAFAAIEVKYSEAMRQPPRSAKERYRELTRAFALHSDPEAQGLLSDPLSQLTAEHLLAALIAKRMGDGVLGIFAVIAPAGNREAWNAIELYGSHLRKREGLPGFVPITLEVVIEAIAKIGDEDLAHRLRDRYVDFTPVHALIDEWEPFAEG